MTLTHVATNSSDDFPKCHLTIRPSGDYLISTTLLHSLCRVDAYSQASGVLRFYLPHAIGMLGASTLGPYPQPLLQLIRINLVFLVGCIFLRGAACSWNDTLDAQYDRLVARSRHRPIARGAVSSFNAYIFTFGLSTICLALLHKLPETSLVPAMTLVITMNPYPFSKRFSHYP